MKLSRSVAGRPMANSVGVFSILALALTFSAGIAAAQGSAPAQPKPDTRTYQTLYLASSIQRNDATDIVTDLRNMLPQAKIYYVPPQNAISMIGTPDDFKLAQKIIADMDRAGKLYRLTYTITEMDNGQPVGKKRVALLIATDGTAGLKQGSRIPVVTGTSNAGSSNPDTEVQYVDVGLSIKATLDGSSDNLRLHTTVVQSSIAEERSGSRTQDPVIDQTTLQSVLTLTQGTPVILGSLDVPGSQRRMEIQVSSELVQ